jgi:hypothetical protein
MKKLQMTAVLAAVLSAGAGVFLNPVMRADGDVRTVGEVQHLAGDAIS